MASPDSPVLVRKASFQSLIAWLSLCLLTTAWGPKLDPTWRERAAQFGSLGLAAAVGLEIAGRARGMIKKRSQQKATIRRIARNVGNAAAHTDSIPHIHQESGADEGLSGKVV